MTRRYVKYSDEQIAQAVASSYSIAEVMRKLNMRWSGGQQQNVNHRIKLAGLDTSHFTGQGWSKGRHSPTRLDASTVLVRDRVVGRVDAQILRRALREAGRAYLCELCGTEPMHNGKPLTLEVDHKNQDWRDNRPENLRFLCPNCHSQQPVRKAPYSNQVEKAGRDSV